MTIPDASGARQDDRPADTGSEERLRRPTPKRKGPIRAFHNRAEAHVEAPAAGAAASASPLQDPDLASVVEGAYRVLDNNVEEGRRAAERFRAAAYGPSEAPPNAKVVADRLVTMTRDMGTAWIDLFSAVLREPELRTVLERILPQDRARRQSTPAPRTATTTVSQRVSSRKPVELTISALPRLDPPAALAIAGLHSLDTTAPPIRQVLFGVRADGGVEVQIVVPDDQPTGAYSGAIVDLLSQQPIGMLSVRVLD